MISNRVFDSNARLTAPPQLRHCACGHPMFPCHDHWYGLVYRCHPRLCGWHLAHITDVEAELTAAYRALRIRESYGLGPEEVRDKAFEYLKLAWIKDGHVVGGAVRFHYS